MINFSTLQGLTIPEGVVTQIADASGRVLWALKSGTKAVLQVAKQTKDTYAGETTYTGESFVAIDVYPKTNGTVKVTYGGLTKTITDTSGVENPNTQTVYFGTLYGVSDSVATPDSGELTIEGQFQAFGCGSYYYMTSKLGQQMGICSCITEVSEWGDVTTIPGSAFLNCTGLALTSLPSGITSIGTSAFMGCTSLALTSLPSGITFISYAAFSGCTSLTNITIPAGVTNIDMAAFFLSAGQRTIYFLGTTPPTLPTDSSGAIQWPFGPSAVTYFVVPKGCGDAYRAAGYVREGHADTVTEAS